MRDNIIIILFLSMWLTSPDCQSQPGFSQYLISDQVHGTQSLYSYDMDNDGDQDILGAAAEDNDIIFWRNEGGNPLKWTKIIVNGNFSGAGTVTGCDINGDGLTDILAGAKTGDQIAWWENSGGDTILWTKHTIRNNYDFPHEVYGCDIDMDGDTDVLAASSLQHEITLWRNGGGTPIDWNEQSIATGFTQAKSVHAGDFNNDGLPDVVAASLINNEISWWQNGGGWPIQWTKHTVTSSFSGAHRVQAVDIDQDGLVDILGTGWYANQIAWWRNNEGNPVSWVKQEIASGFTRTCIGIAVDLDGDNDIDVVGSAQDGDEVAWFQNDGNYPINWTKITIDPTFIRVWPVCAADFDGDSDIDIAAASGHEGNNEVRWYESNLVAGFNELQETGKAFHLLTVSPNPCREIMTLNFTLSIPQSIRIELLTFQGMILRSESFLNLSQGEHRISFDLAKYSPGIYLVRLITNEKDETIKCYFMH